MAAPSPFTGQPWRLECFKRVLRRNQFEIEAVEDDGAEILRLLRGPRDVVERPDDVDAADVDLFGADDDTQIAELLLDVDAGAQLLIAPRSESESNQRCHIKRIETHVAMEIQSDINQLSVSIPSNNSLLSSFKKPKIMVILFADNFIS